MATKTKAGKKCSACGKGGHNKATCETRREVFLMWMGENQTWPDVSVLNSRDGVRVYRRDELDPRIMLGRTEPPPLFEDLQAALQHIKKNRGSDNAVLLPVKYAGAFNLTRLARMY